MIMLFYWGCSVYVTIYLSLCVYACVHIYLFFCLVTYFSLSSICLTISVCHFLSLSLSLFLSLSLSLYIYIYICVCVCVCTVKNKSLAEHLLWKQSTISYKTVKTNSDFSSFIRSDSVLTLQKMFCYAHPSG